MTGYSKIDEILERSDEVKEVMAHIPNWMIRWGMTYVFVCIISLVVMSAFIRYPDVITSQVILTTSNPPARIVAQASGKLNHISFKENDQVEEGALLGIIENSASSKDVLNLSRLLHAIQFTDLIKEQNIDLPNNISLGDLQKEYALFYRAYSELKLFQNLDPVAKEITSTRQEVKAHTDLLDKQLREKELYQTEIGLAQKDYDRNLSLFKGNVIADKQIEDNERELLRTKRSYEQLESSIAATKIKLSELQKALALLEIQNEERRSQYELSLTESYKTLLGALSNWEQKYLLTSPITGRVTYLKFWSSNQYVNTGEEVMVIVPGKHEAVIGKVSMPVQNSGKVKVGQSVNIYLKNFPYQEFGTLQGQVKSISLVPKDNLYAIEITLPNGLKTSYNKKLNFNQEMQGNAEIVTEELMLLERIFYQLRVLSKTL